MKGLALPRRDWPLIVAGALLLALAYPPFHLLLPSFTCLVPVVWLLSSSADDPRPVRRRLVQGFWYGLFAHGLVLYWLIVALWHFTPLSAAGYVATVVVLALFDAGLFAVVGWLRDRARVPLILVLPVCWTALEWGVGHLGDVRFPWLGLGTSLTGFPMLVQIADVVGARGITFLLVMANVALAPALVRWQDARAVRSFVGVGVGILLALGYGAWRMGAVALRPVGSIALVQPNVGFQDKWEEVRQQELFSDLLALSQQAVDATNPDMVIWPEAAVAASFVHRPVWERRIARQGATTSVPILAGGIDYVQYDAEDYEYWNAAFLFDSTGSRAAFPAYRKRYLVPVTERVPFVNPRWFDLRFFGAFSVGRQAPLFETALGRFGVIICYESAFEDLARMYRRRGADFVVNMTNDAWFGRTSAPRQHFAHLVMRAIENRVGIARAANSGISGYVDPLGRAYGRTALDERVTTTDVLITSDSVPPYTRWGDWVGLFNLLALAALVGRAAWRRP